MHTMEKLHDERYGIPLAFEWRLELVTFCIQLSAPLLQLQWHTNPLNIRIPSSSSRQPAIHNSTWKARKKPTKKWDHNPRRPENRVTPISPTPLFCLANPLIIKYTNPVLRLHPCVVYIHICASNITRSQLGELSTFVSHLRGPPVTLPHLTTLWIRRFFAGCLCPLSAGPKKSFLQLSSHDTTNVQNLDKTSPSSTPAGPFLSLNSANTILPSVNQPKENYYRIFTLFTLNVLRSPWFSLLFFFLPLFSFFSRWPFSRTYSTYPIFFAFILLCPSGSSPRLATSRKFICFKMKGE